MDTSKETQSKDSKEIESLEQDRPLVSLNVPFPKDVVGKVKVKTISTKTQVRYRTKGDPEEYKVCEPQYKITRLWNATVSKTYPLEDTSSPNKSNSIQYESYEKSKDMDSEKCKMSFEKKLSRLSLSSYSSISLYENALFSSSCDSNEEEDDYIDGNSSVKFPRTKSTPSFNSYDSLSSKDSSSEKDSEIDEQMIMKHSVTPYKGEILNNTSQNVDVTKRTGRSCVTPPNGCPSPLMYSSLNISTAKSHHAYKTYVKSSYSKSFPCGPTSTGTSLEKFQVPDTCDKICRTVIAEKKLQYIMANEPDNIISPKILTRKFKTFECLDPACRHHCYFTGIGRVAQDTLKDIAIFGVERYNLCRIETRLRTTIIIERDSDCDNFPNDIKSFIGRHNIDEDISDCFY
ncbi:unnamed protein product [Lepeophtheirus salmonis]|uniref:(salmon louse) hypothetical protein n=1 Tax=Lepeophtheirus salmonis TaxID=72036 RepID=A0A817FAG2_LEPSM|nr:unnamed protein product [Lepeophtheirus salmonis]CAG9474893.1 unnamed protein product [Lepeophtheirus salmonis]